jgi:ankyrin repeat protein
VSLLVREGAQRQAKAGGLTPLMLACEFGSMQCVLTLVACGGSVDEVDSANQTALHKCAMFGRT